MMPAAMSWLLWLPGGLSPFLVARLVQQQAHFFELSRVRSRGRLTTTDSAADWLSFCWHKGGEAVQ